MNVQIKEMPALRVATVEHVGAYNQISEAFGKLGDIAGRAGLFGPATMMLAIYHDDPDTTPPEELRSEAALSVDKTVALPAGVGERRLRGGAYACAVHVGSYEGLGDAWARLLGDWLPQSGHRLADDVCFEIYRNNPATTEAHELRTEICIPLAEPAAGDAASSAS